MKTKPFLSLLLIVIGLVAATTGTFFLGRLLPGSKPVSASGDPPLSHSDLPSQTVNGITARIQSYYVDASRLVFVVHIDGEGDGYSLGDISLKKAGEDIYSSDEVSLLSDDTSTFSVDIVTTHPVEGERLDGQLAFKVFASDGEEPALAGFQFDLDLPVHPELTFNPRRSVSANGVEILLDRVVMTPAFTQVYLCYVPPSDADWGFYNDTTLQVNSQVGHLETYNLLFDDKLADGSKGGEPGWTAPVKVGRCVKVGFQVGDAHPKSLKLTILALEQSMPEGVPDKELAAAYKKLQAQGIDMEWHQVDHGAYPEYKKLPEGMTREEAFRHFAKALGYVYPGEWIFEIALDS